MLMGNITVTAIWKYFADRTHSPEILSFAQKLVTYTDWSMTVWGAVALTGVLATAAAFLIQTWAQKSTTAVSTAVVFAMEPVMAALFSGWLSGDLLSWTAASGGVLMIAGMLVAELVLPGQKKPDTAV